MVQVGEAHLVQDAGALPEEDEQALLLAVKSGDRQALGRAVDRHLGLVHALAYGMVGNASDAEDICQEVFVRLQEGAPNLRADGSLRLWLYRTCINCCIDELRRRCRRPVALLGWSLEDAASAGRGPEELAAEREFARQVAACLLHLPPRQRAVFTLRHFVGLSTHEIAEALGCSPGTVKCHLSRALAGLRDLLPPESAGSPAGRLPS